MYPPWLKEAGGRIITTQYEDGSTTDVPDLDDAVVLKAHLSFIERLGARYDGHPDLDHMDLGSVGWWGEWHMHASTKAPLPSVQTRKSIIAAYVKAFRRTPLLIPIGAKADHLLRYAIDRGAGWRADCLGDMCGTNRPRCHMNTYYPEAIQQEQVMDAWKNAPVAWESCWTLDKWVKEGWSLRSIFNYALAVHGSYLNNKSSRLPDTPEVRKEVERFLRRLGYRLVLRELQHPSHVRPGTAMKVMMKWQNVGSAPCYRPYRLAYRISGKGKSVRVVGDVAVNRWLPGSVEVFTPSFFETPPDLPPGEVHAINDLMRIPADLPPGEYAFSIAVVDPADGNPVGRLAIKGRTDDGWYPVSKVAVEH